MRLRPRGNWTPAHLTRRDCTVLIASVCIIALVRALDYMVGMDASPRPSGPPPATVVLSEDVPLAFWGAAIAAGVLLLAVGAFVRRHSMVYLGHGLLMCVYLSLFVGTLIPLLGQQYLDGVRGAGALLGPVVIHFLFWLRTGPRPIKEANTRTAETVWGPA